jgi:WD40 repeat protein
VTALAFSPDSRLLCVAHGADVAVWNMIYEDETTFQDETSRSRLPEHPGLVLGAAVSPDGKSFATACADGVVRFWAAAGGKPLSSLDFQAGGLGSVAFSPDGMIGAAGTLDGRIVLWDVL